MIRIIQVSGDLMYCWEKNEIYELVMCPYFTYEGQYNLPKCTLFGDYLTGTLKGYKKCPACLSESIGGK